MMGHDYYEESNYEQLIGQFRSCLNSLNSEYFWSEHKPHNSRKAWFAIAIVKVLLNHVGLLKLMNRLAKKDLVDSLTTHKSKYIEILSQENTDPEIILAFRANIKNLITHLGARTNNLNNKLTKEELEMVKNDVKNLAYICQALFAEQNHNQEIIDKLQASAIAYNINCLSVTQQAQLTDKLLLIKEIWQLNNTSHVDKDSLIVLFHLNPSQVLQEYQLLDNNSTFDHIIKLFIDNYQGVGNLTNGQLIALYDRLKNLELKSASVTNLLQNIHTESSYRYSDSSRMADSEVQLLTRFQVFDNISNQIKNSEYSLTEAFLTRNNAFIQETLIFIAKHTDNIKAVGALKSPLLNDVLSKIKLEFPTEHPNDASSASVIIMLSLIKSKFLSNPESQTLRRYSELDKFSINLLQNKYVSLFENIKNLLYRVQGYKEFLQSVIIRRLSEEHYTPSVSSSLNKLKLLHKERLEVAKQLSEIDFVEVFNPKYNNNTLSRLTIRQLVTAEEAKTVSEYVHSIIKNLVSNCNPAQLETLCQPILQGNLTATRITLKEEIINQVKQRTTFMKRLLYVVTGQRSDLNKLKSIENAL